MHKAFTLIEILVVITMLSILMMLIAPAGLKVVERVDNFIDRKNAQKDVDKLQFQAFLEAQEINASTHALLSQFDILSISSKGVIKTEDTLIE